MSKINVAPYIHMFGCDTARIVTPMGKLFLIIGWRRNTKDDRDGQWFKDGEPIHFDYTKEKVIASGSNAKELMKSAKHYRALLDMEKNHGTD